MTKENYFDILFTGYLDNPKFLQQYFVRECKKAEALDVTPLEFFNRLYEAITSLRENIDIQYGKRKSELLMIIGLLKEKGEDIKEIVEEKEDLQKSYFSINLLHFTNSKYIGNLWADSIEFIADELDKAMEIISNELKIKLASSNNENKKVEKLSLASIFNEKNNSFEVCKGLFEDLELIIAGNSTMKPGRVGKLTGIITAIKETPGMLIIDRPTDNQLLPYFNSYLNTKYKTFSKRNADFNESLDTSKRYIKNNFKK